MQYYSFGLTFADGAEKQPYKYNGKEFDTRLQLKLTDYLVRQNNTQYGRFISIDPLAEKYYSISLELTNVIILFHESFIHAELFTQEFNSLKNINQPSNLNERSHHIQAKKE